MTIRQALWLSTSVCVLVSAGAGAASAQEQAATPAAVSPSDQQATDDAPTPTAANQTGTEVDEIIVTAGKRPELLFEVPGAISAYRGSDLLESGLTSIADLATLTPGLQFNNGLGSGAPVIRGLTQGIDTSPTVASVVNGAPIGSSSSLSLGAQDALDLDPVDFTRVEVLRGPQGTLYGANTLGGLISYVLRDAATDRFGGVARAEVSVTEEGGVNYSLRGAADIPIRSDVAGIRVSGFYDDREGFIDNARRGLEDQNESTRWGVRVGGVFTPSERLEVRLDGFHQETDITAGDVVVYDFRGGGTRNGDLQYDEVVLPAADKEITVGIANVDFSFDFATLTSVTSLQHIESDNVQNQTNSSTAALLGALLPRFGGPAFPTPTTVQLNRLINTDKLTQELRLASPGEGRFTWIVGGYYSFEDNNYSALISGRNQNGSAGPTVNPSLNATIFSDLEETSVFANGTFELTPQIDLTGGIRYGRIDQSFQQTLSGANFASYNTFLALNRLTPVPAVTPVSGSEDTFTTYLATARYRINPENILFARFATGFRPGGPNLTTPGLPATFDPDRTTNYEVGYRGRTADGRASIDITGYFVDWRDIITVVSVGGFSGYTNGGDAEVFGIEAAATLRPTDALRFAATLAVNESRITDVEPSAVASLGVGDPLPYNPDITASFSAEYRRPLGDGRWTGYAAATARYASDRLSGFRSRTTSPIFEMQEYGFTDVRAGVEDERYTLDVFIRNVTDERAQLAANSFYNLGEVTVLRPRTFGVALTVNY